MCRRCVCDIFHLKIQYMHALKFVSRRPVGPYGIRKYQIVGSRHILKKKHYSYSSFKGVKFAPDIHVGESVSHERPSVPNPVTS